MNRPHIICHMGTSIDGKVTGEFLSRPECEKATEIYYEINRNYKADGFICGRETMQESFAGKEDAPRYIYKNVEVPSGDFIGDKNAKFFAVSFDRHGHIGWKSNYIKDEDPGYDNAHIIEVVEGDAVSALSLAYFRDIGISYIGADTEGENIPLALQKLKENFGFNKLLLEMLDLLEDEMKEKALAKAYVKILLKLMSEFNAEASIWLISQKRKNYYKKYYEICKNAIELKNAK